MIELIDIDGSIKFMASIISGIKYANSLYVLYSIKRDEEEDNIFVSKLVKNSDGYAMDNDFSGGEKEIFDDVIKSFLSKEDLSSLKVELFNDFKLSSINKFSVTKCYISTCKKNMIKECMKNYDLINNNKIPIVREKEASYFSKNNFSNIILIIFGIMIIIMALIVIINYFK